MMSVHSEPNGRYRVRWRDEDAINRSRTFRRKRDADRFDRRIKELKAETREKGYTTLPGSFDVNDPRALDVVIEQLRQLLNAEYPDHVFTISYRPADAEQLLPLVGNIEWEAQTRADFERERRTGLDGRRHTR